MIDFTELQLHARMNADERWFAWLRTSSSIVDRTASTAQGFKNWWQLEPVIYGVPTEQWFCSPKFEAATRSEAEKAAVEWLAQLLGKVYE